MSTISNVGGYRNGYRGRGVMGAYGRNRKRRRRNDTAVEGVQESGRVLSRFFDKLERRCKARKLVDAIRRCDAWAVQDLLDDRRCRVLGFCPRPGFDCVKICCVFGRRRNVVVTFDICVSRYTGDVNFNYY